MNATAPDRELSITSDLAGQKADVATVFRAFGAAGFPAVHWCHDWIGEPVFYDRDLAGRVLDLAARNRLRIADVHGFHGTDKTAITATLELYLAMNINRAEFARAVGAAAVVLHLPPPRGQAGVDAVAESVATLRALRPAFEGFGVRAAVENLPWASHTPAFFDALLAEFPPEYLGLCFDSGHALLAGQNDLLRRHAGRIIVTHLHDNPGVSDGAGDKHWLPGRGKVDWPAVLGALKAGGYRGTVNLECHQDPDMPLEDFCTLARQTIARLWAEAPGS